MRKKLLSLCLVFFIFLTQNSSFVFAEGNIGEQTVDFSVILNRGDGIQETLQETQKDTLAVNGEENEFLEIQMHPSDEQNIYEYEFSSISNGEKSSLGGLSTNSALDITQSVAGEYAYSVDIFQSGQKIGEKFINLNISGITDTPEGNSEISERIEEAEGDIEESSVMNRSNSVEEVLELQGTLESNVGEQTYVGSLLVLAAEVSQGNGGYQYKFEEEYQSDRRVIQEFSEESVYSGEMTKSGVHNYYVTIKDAQGKLLELSCAIDVKEKVAETENKKAVFLGDSLTARNDWAAMYPEYEVKNEGVKSDTTQNMLARVNEVIEWKPELVFVMGGINDLNSGISSSQIVGNIEKIINNIHSELPEAIIYVQSVLPTSEQKVSNGKVVALNNSLETMCESRDAQFVNLYPYFFGDNQIKTDLYDGSGIHLNATGYNVWKSVLDTVLNGGEVITSELRGRLTNSATANEYVARTMTLTAEVTSGNGGYTYQFEEEYDGKRTVVQEASEDNTYTFTTKEVGIHTYYVTIKDAKGKSLTLSYRMNVVMNPGLVLKGAVKSSTSSTQYEDRAVTLTAEMTSGYGEYEYQFTEVYNGKSEVVQKYSEESSYSFRTEGVGIHTYYIDVRDGIGQTLRLSYVLDVREYPSQTLAGTLTNSATANEYVMRTMTLTAKVTSGGGGYTYQFEEEYDGKRTVVQEASEDNTYTFTTKEVGIHTYYVTIKDAKGKSLTLSYRMNVVMNPGLVLKGAVKSSTSSTQYEDRAVTLTAEMTSGYGEYEYQFTEVYNGKSEVVQKYSEESSYSFRTEGVGIHTYYIDVRDGIGQTLRLSYVLDVREYPSQTLAGTLTNSATANEYVMRTMTLTAKVTSGGGGYTYQFEEEYDGKRTVVQEASEDNTYTFTTKEVGIHTYYVTIKDAKGKSLTLSYRMNVVMNPGLVLKGAVKSSTSSTQYEDRAVTLTAEMTSGYGEYEYQFTEVYNGKSEVVQKYSEESSYSFRTEGVGIHTYYIDVRDGIGQTLRLSYVLDVREYPSQTLAGTLTNSATANEYVMRTMTLTAKVTSGGGGYTYQFEEEYDGKRTVVQEASEDNTYTFTTKEVGIHTYYVTIKDAKGKSLTLSYRMNVVMNPGLVLKGAVKSSTSSTQYEDRAVTLTAEMTSGYGEYEYQFTEVYNGKSEVVQKYSEESSYSFRTEGVGIHTYYIDVRDGIGQTLRLSYVLDVREYPSQTLAGTLTNSATANEYVMRTMTLTAKVTSGGGGYTYQFEEEYDGKRTVVQEASEDNTYTFTTKEVGIHTYYVTIKDAKGKSLTLSYRMNVVMNPGLVLKGAVKSSTSSTQYEDRAVTLTAEMTSGYGEYEYQFTEVYNGKSEVVQKYSEESSYSFRTEGVGIHTYYIDVRDGIGQTLRLSYVLDVREYPSQTLAGTLTNSATANEYVMRTMTLTAEVTSGNGGYTYQFEEEYDGKRTVVQEASEDNTYTFTTKEVGIHTYYVTIKDAKGKSLTLSYRMNVVSHPLSILKGTLTNSSSNNEYVQRNMYLTATASGGYGDYQYQFEELYDGKRNIVQEYSEKNTYSFTTETVGTHIYYVTIKDSANQSVTVSYSMTVVSHPSMKITGTLTSNKTNYEYSSRDIILTATLTSEGYGECEYEFVRVYKGVSKIVQQYSGENTYSFRTGLPGNYIYQVNVKDKSNTVASFTYAMTVVSNGTFDQGIDVSAWQGTIDWAQVKNSGVSFAMLRVLSGTMSGLQVDSQFYNNAKGTNANGIAIGVYRYGYATTVSDAKEEAIRTIQALKIAEGMGVKITYPVAYDVEDEATQGQLSKGQLANIINAYKSVIEDYGYKFMIYANTNWLTNKIDMSSFAGDDIWLARWFYDGSPYHDHGYMGPGNVTIWQYSSSGTVPGISGNVDMNVGYIRY